jgi:hypothetical protein
LGQTEVGDTLLVAHDKLFLSLRPLINRAGDAEASLPPIIVETSNREEWGIINLLLLKCGPLLLSKHTACLVWIAEQRRRFG